MLANSLYEVQLFVIVIAQEGSFLRASKKLSVSQPTLTRRVAQYEKELGTRLFDRTTRRLQLTRAGRIFLPEAQAALRHAERAWELARHIARIENGPFRLGYSPWIHSALLPLLRHLDLHETEAAALVLESMTTTSIAERVLRGKLHAGVGVMPILDEDLWVKSIGQEPFYLCVPRTHRLAQKAAITVKDIHGETVFWLPRSAHRKFYDNTVDYIHGLGTKPVFEETLDVLQVIEFAAHNCGIGLVPRSAIRLTRTGVIFKSLSDRYLRIETALFARKDQRHGSLQESMDDILFRLEALKLSIQ